MKYITLTLKRKMEPDLVKQLAFQDDETAHDVVEEGRRYWGFPAHADLRLCKESGLPLRELDAGLRLLRPPYRRAHAGGAMTALLVLLSLWGMALRPVPAVLPADDPYRRIRRTYSTETWL